MWLDLRDSSFFDGISSPFPSLGPDDAGHEERVNGDDIDVFPMQWAGIQATGTSQHVQSAAAMRARRGANVDVGRETSRAGWGSAW